MSPLLPRLPPFPDRLRDQVRHWSQHHPPLPGSRRQFDLQIRALFRLVSKRIYKHWQISLDPQLEPFQERILDVVAGRMLEFEDAARDSARVADFNRRHGLHAAFVKGLNGQESWNNREAALEFSP